MDPNVKKLNKSALLLRSSRIIATKEGLKDVTPFNFSENSKVIVSRMENINVQSERHNNN